MLCSNECQSNLLSRVLVVHKRIDEVPNHGLAYQQLQPFLREQALLRRVTQQTNVHALAPQARRQQEGVGRRVAAIKQRPDVGARRRSKVGAGGQDGPKLRNLRNKPVDVVVADLGDARRKSNRTVDRPEHVSRDRFVSLANEDGFRERKRNRQQTTWFNLTRSALKRLLSTQNQRPKDGLFESLIPVWL